MSKDFLFVRHRGEGEPDMPLSSTSIRKSIDRVASKALGEGSHIRVHAFRHYYVTEVLRKTGNLEMARRLARHKNIQTTTRYVSLSDDEVQQAYDEAFD